MELILQVLALEPTSQVLSEEPIVAFAVLVAVILVIPILFERLRLPGLIGLVLSGVILGPSGWNFFHSESPIISLLSDIGLLYLMFVAGLEVEIKHFRRDKQRSLGFGILTFIFPLITGTLVGHIFDWGWNGAILTGSLLASHTLVAYPIITRLGLINHQPVTITMGATAFTNFGAVLLLAICLATRETEILSLRELLPLLIWLTIYTIIILFGCDRLGKEFFRRCGEDEGNKFLFVLLSVFVAAVGAQFLGIETIVGAFIAGLAVNQVLGEEPVKEKVSFIGNLIFIPIFLINYGLTIDLSQAFTNIITLQLTVLIVLGLISSKLMAAVFTQLLYRYNWGEMLTIWSLSLPQMGITLAATFVGYRAGLLPEAMLNSVVVLMLVTSILGLWITNHSAGALVDTAVAEVSTSNTSEENTETQHSPATILVPLYNPQTQQHLMEMAALLANQAQARIVPLAIAMASAQMDAPQLETSLRRSQRLLAKATAQSRLLGIEATPLLRIDDAFALGISRAAREQQASLILMGWGKRTGFRARLFGNVIDNVIWSAHCPVAVTRLMDSPKKIQRILVPLENLTASSLQSVQFAQMLADANQAQVTVLHVCIPESRRWRSHNRSSSPTIAAKREHLSQFISQLSVTNPPEIQVVAHENAAQAILQAARLYDLVVLPFIRNRAITGGLAISDMTNQLAAQLTCSIVMLGEPQENQKQILFTNVTSSTLHVSPTSP